VQRTCLKGVGHRKIESTQRNPKTKKKKGQREKKAKSLLLGEKNPLLGASKTQNQKKMVVEEGKRLDKKSSSG